MVNVKQNLILRKDRDQLRSLYFFAVFKASIIVKEVFDMKKPLFKSKLEMLIEEDLASAREFLKTCNDLELKIKIMGQIAEREETLAKIHNSKWDGITKVAVGITGAAGMIVPWVIKKQAYNEMYYKERQLDETQISMTRSKWSTANLLR